MQLVLPVKEGKAPTKFSSGQTGFSPDGIVFNKFTLAANVPQNAYIDTSLPRWS